VDERDILPQGTRRSKAKVPPREPICIIEWMLQDLVINGMISYELLCTEEPIVGWNDGIRRSAVLCQSTYTSYKVRHRALHNKQSLQAKERSEGS